METASNNDEQQTDRDVIVCWHKCLGLNNEAGKMAKKQPKFCWHHGDRKRLLQCLDNGYCDCWHPDDSRCARFHKLQKGDRVRFSVNGSVVRFGTIQSQPNAGSKDCSVVYVRIEPVDSKWPGAVNISDICECGPDCKNCSSTPMFGSHWLNGA